MDHLCEGVRAFIGSRGPAIAREIDWSDQRKRRPARDRRPIAKRIGLAQRVSTVISTRRFCALPDFVLFDALGCDEP